LSVNLDVLAFVVEGEAFLADPVNYLLSRDGHAGTSSSARARSWTAEGTSHRTTAPGGGSGVRSVHPFWRRKTANSSCCRRLVSRRAIASFAHSWNSCQVSPIALRFKGRQTPMYVPVSGSQAASQGTVALMRTRTGIGIPDIKALLSTP